MSELGTNILNDDRKISALYLDIDGQYKIEQGETVWDPDSHQQVIVSGIIPYRETGQAAYVPWFKIVDHAGVVLQRVNAAMVARVVYSLIEEAS